MRIYLAGPIFFYGDYLRNIEWATKIREKFPNGDVLPSGTCAEIGKFHEKIMRGDNKYIIGICTDTRQCYNTHSAAKDAGGAASLGEQQYSYQNLYVTGLIKQAGTLVYSIEEVIEVLESIYDQYDN